MWKYVELSYTLASLYYIREDAFRLTIAAGLKPEFISFGYSAINNWTNILKDAENKGKIGTLLDIVLIEHSDNKIIQAYRVNADSASAKGISSYSGTKIDWKGTKPASQLEKIMGIESTLMPIHFLELGLIKANSVARVETPDGYGSGFLIADNFFVTNNHVIESEANARKTVLRFNYQKTQDGMHNKHEEFNLDPSAGFVTSLENDWTIVKINGDANSKYGALPLQKCALKLDDFVNIIQHPGGEHKQIALYHNFITFADESRVQYLTDTLPGSSGSPVFNSDWEVVALHHSGGWMVEPGTSNEYYRNEGIRGNLLVEEFTKLGFI